MTAYLGNPRESILNAIKEFNKIGYKISNENSIEFTYTNDNQLKDIMNGKVQFLTSTKQRKCLRRNLRELPDVQAGFRKGRGTSN